MNDEERKKKAQEKSARTKAYTVVNRISVKQKEELRQFISVYFQSRDRYSPRFELISQSRG